MKNVRMAICLVLMFLFATGSTRADFILYGSEQLTVNSSYSNGYLYDASRVFVVSGGDISDYLYAYNYSTANISRGWVSRFYSYGNSTVNVSGGDVGNNKSYDYSIVNVSDGNAIRLYSYNYSTVNISGGSVSWLYSYNNSTVNISGGWVDEYLESYGNNTVNISGGDVGGIYPCDNSTVNISGGWVDSVSVYGTANYSTITFYGKNFHYGSGLTLNGNRVLGTGILSGEWLDGTRWAVNISYNVSTASILITTEPAQSVCLERPIGDFNNDCKVNFKDFAIFASHWLDCNLDPPSTCWE